MLRVLCGSLLMLALGAVAPQAAEAQLFKHLFSDSCQKCSQPLCSCCCPCVDPVVETCFRQEQCVNYKTVQCVGSRPEQYTETVPVQKQHNICVDEGCWKMVWCPKPVVKTVCKTEYQQRVCTRQVPYTYNVTVPEVTTRVVPQQRVKYVPRTCGPYHPVCPPTPTCAMPAAVPGCAAPVVPQSALLTVPQNAAMVAAPAAMPAPLTAQFQQPYPQPQPNVAGLTPAPAAEPLDASAQWMTVPSRQQPTAQPQPVMGAGGQVAPPSAATVWQTRPTVGAF